MSERLHEINYEMPRAPGAFRVERFWIEEQPRLGNLPEYRFTEVEWKSPKVGRNYPVTLDTQKCFVPYRCVGEIVRARITATHVTIFYGADTIIAEHACLTGGKGQYSTSTEHVPKAHRDVAGLWSRDSFQGRAERFGESTSWANAQVLDRHAVEAHDYLDCQNILDGLGRSTACCLKPRANTAGVVTRASLTRV